MCVNLVPLDLPQKGLLEVIYDIFRLPMPVATADFIEALISVGGYNVTFCVFIQVKSLSFLIVYLMYHVLLGNKVYLSIFLL